MTFVITGHTIDQSRVDMKVDPNFMMATLILFLETQRAPGEGEGSMIAKLPVVFELGGSKNPLAHLQARTMEKGAQWQWQVRIDERLFNTAGEPRIAARLTAPCSTVLKSPATKSTCG